MYRQTRSIGHDSLQEYYWNSVQTISILLNNQSFSGITNRLRLLYIVIAYRSVKCTCLRYVKLAEFTCNCTSTEHFHLNIP